MSAATTGSATTEVVREDSVAFKCFSCGAPCSATLEPPEIVHKLPVCRAYDRIKTLEDGSHFVRCCRVKASCNFFEQAPAPFPSNSNPRISSGKK